MFDAKSLLDSLVQGVSQIGDSLQNSQPGVMLGRIGNTASQAFDQATSGVKEAAGKAVEATGADEKLDAVVGKVSGGQTAGDLLEQAKDIIGENKLETGAVLGGLSALLLGSKRGRKLTKRAATMGGVALIGGLAYKAFQNHRAGKPLLGGEEAPPAPPLLLPEAPPDDSGFGSKALTNDQALLMVRAMIAAAASDHEVDETERLRITLGLKDSGLENEAADFLDQEIQHPISVKQLASGADSPELAAQVYTAARLTIEPDSAPEQAFLTDLAQALALEETVVEHLDEGVTAVKEAA